MASSKIPRKPPIPSAEKQQMDILKAKVKPILAGLGDVRHPKRCIKIYARRDKKDLFKDSDGKLISGSGAEFVKVKEDIAYKTDSDLSHKFKDKWIHLNFLEDKEWWQYDPLSIEDNPKNRKDQIEKFGRFGFIKVNTVEKELNEYNIFKTGYELLNANDLDLINCSFGYNYDQPSMGVNLNIGNKKGYNRDLIHSGDLIKIYMWYDRPGDSKFQSDVDSWLDNNLIELEDQKFNLVTDQSINEIKTIEQLSDNQGASIAVKKLGVNLMYQGIIDDLSFEYSKQSGSIISMTGRSLGAVLTAARVYKSYPLPNRLKMAHEEVIYDIVKNQTGLSIATISLSNGNWMTGMVNLNNNNKVIPFSELYESSSGDQLDNITREELEVDLNERYETEIVNAMKTYKSLEYITDIEGIANLSQDFINSLDLNTNIESDKPVNNGKAYNIQTDEDNITSAELQSKGFTSPIWIYSDGKTGKDNHGGFPDTSIKLIIENLMKINRKIPVELKSEYWGKYGITMPSIVERDGATVKPVRVFFYTGWNAIKYIIQERAISTSNNRSPKIYAMRNFANNRESFAQLSSRGIDAQSPDELRKKYAQVEEQDYILYQAPINFDVIQFAVDLRVIDSDELIKEEKDKIHTKTPVPVKNTETDEETGEKTEETKKEVEKDGIEYILIEQALNSEWPTYKDAMLRMQLFYNTIRQYTRAYHDLTNSTNSPKSWYPNTDGLAPPNGKAKFKAAVNFPTVKKGEIIVVPKELTNAPRTWTVNVKVNSTSEEGVYRANLQNDITGIFLKSGTEADTSSENKGSNAFKKIVNNEVSDELKEGSIKMLPNNIFLDKVGLWGLNFKADTNVTDGQSYKISFEIIEDAALFKESKQKSKDMVFEGNTVFEAVKQVSDKHFDIVQYVDEYGLYHVRPRGASKLSGQINEYVLESGSNGFPKYISGRIVQNISQIINRVVIMGISPGYSEFMVVTIEDKASILKYGVKQAFEQINSIDNVIEAITRAKSLLMNNRMKTTQAEINCEPMFDLRPGHTIRIYDVSSGLSGQYIVENIGLNYAKNSGAVQTFTALSWGNILDTSELEGKVAYFSKENGGDVLREQKQFTESEMKILKSGGTL